MILNHYITASTQQHTMCLILFKTYYTYTDSSFKTQLWVFTAGKRFPVKGISCSASLSRNPFISVCSVLHALLIGNIQNTIPVFRLRFSFFGLFVCFGVVVFLTYRFSSISFQPLQKAKRK